MIQDLARFLVLLEPLKTAASDAPPSRLIITYIFMVMIQ
jgi:hypothetical protein